MRLSRSKLAALAVNGWMWGDGTSACGVIALFAAVTAGACFRDAEKVAILSQHFLASRKLSRLLHYEYEYVSDFGMHKERDLVELLTLPVGFFR